MINDNWKVILARHSFILKPSLARNDLIIFALQDVILFDIMLFPTPRSINYA